MRAAPERPDPMDRWPRTAAGGRLFTDIDPMDMMESNGVTWDDIRAVEDEAAAAPVTDAGLREALERIADPELVDAPGGFYCPWCGTNVNVHGTTCPTFIARAALSRQAEKETA